MLCATISHLRRPVEARLDVGVHGAILKAGAAKVYDLDVPRVQALKKDILWLEVAVNDVRLAQH